MKLFFLQTQKNILKSRKNMVQVFIFKDQKISKDTSSSFQVINHAISFLKSKNLHFDIVVLLEPTSPLTNHKDIDQAIKMMVEKNIYLLFLLWIHRNTI